MMAPSELGEKNIAILAATVAVLGLIFLFYFGQQIQPKQIAMASLASQPENSFVEVVGSIRSISSKSGSLLITLCEFSDCTTVFVPSSASDELRLNPYLLKSGNRIVVRGRVQVYKGEQELVPQGADGMELV
jgi:DNA/RNA endonuclease YhcR with UshA esterase domain